MQDRFSGPRSASDFVQVNRVRREVVDICNELLTREMNPAAQQMVSERFWVLATLAEAWLGLDDEPQSTSRLKQAFDLNVADWMRSSPTDRLTQLRGYLADSPLRHVMAVEPG